MGIILAVACVLISVYITAESGGLFTLTAFAVASAFLSGLIFGEFFSAFSGGDDGDSGDDGYAPA